MAKGRPRILIIHHKHRAEAAQIERGLNGNARVRVIWQQEEILNFVKNPPMDQFDVVVLFPVILDSRQVHEQIAMQLSGHEQISVVAIGRSGDWNGGREQVCRFCRTPIAAARFLQEQFTHL